MDAIIFAPFALFRWLGAELFRDRLPRFWKVSGKPSKTDSGKLSLPESILAVTKTEMHGLKICLLRFWKFRAILGFVFRRSNQMVLVTVLWSFLPIPN